MFKYVRQIFTDGMNMDMDPAAIDLTSSDDVTISLIASTVNFMFIRGILQSRPPMQAATDTKVMTDTVEENQLSPYFSQYPVPSSFPYFLCGIAHITPIDQLNPNCFKFKTDLTGPAITPAYSGGFAVKATSVNGVVLIAGYNGGLVRWVPGAAAYTLVAPAGINWAYLTKLYSRAIGAFNLLNGSGVGQLQVGASAAGNESDWTSLNAYNTTLSDVDDYITGLCTIRGNIVVARSKGFHVGFPTGTFPALFNWSAFSFDDIGCAYPGSLAVFDRKAYFLSDQGVFTYDLNTIEYISDGINADLAVNAGTGSNVNGFIAQNITDDYRPLYCLGPMFSNGNFGFYIYDIVDKKWTTFAIQTTAGHTYFGGSVVNFSNFSGNFVNPPSGWNYIGIADFTNASKSTNIQRIGFHTRAFAPADSTAVDFASSFVTGQISVSPSYIEAGLSRILLVFYSQAASATLPTISVTSLLNNTSTTLSFTAVTANSTVAGWNRMWFSGRSTGQMFQATVTFPTAIGTWPIKVKEMFLEFTDSAKERA